MPIRTRTPVKPRRPWSWVKALTWAYFALLVLLLCLGGFLWKSGEILVQGDAGTEPLRWAAVLAGENREMERSEAAWALFQEGRFDSLILSGPRVFKTRHASEFSFAFLESKGFPKDRLFQLPSEASSTADEAAILIRQARRLGIDTLLLITSDFHSARVGKIYRKLAGDYPAIRVFAASTPGFDPRAWWSSRQGKETWLVEWLKTAYTAWEIFRHKPLEGVAEFILLEPNPRPAAEANEAASAPNSSILALVKDTSQASKDTLSAKTKADSVSAKDSAASADTLKKKAK